MHSVPKGSQTHFKVEIVSEQFEQKKILERHRLVNQVLADEIAKIRACSIYTFTSSEWEKIKKKDFHSPTCAGGSKNP
jgi:BolA protein